MYITNNIFSVKFNIVPPVFPEADRFDDNNDKVIQRWWKQDGTMGSWAPTPNPSLDFWKLFKATFLVWKFIFEYRFF